MKPKDIDERDPLASPPMSRLVIWLAVLGMGICFMPMLLISTTLKTHQQALQTEVFELQTTLTAPPAVSDETNTLSQSLIEAQKTLKQVTTLQSTLEALHLDWIALMGTIGAYDTSTLALTNLTHTQHQITLTGQGRQETDVMEYIDELRRSGQFDQVTIQSVIRVETTPTPALMIAATPSIDSTPPYQVDFVLVLSVKAVP